MIGRHLLADLGGIQAARLRDRSLLESAMRDAAHAAKLTPVCPVLVHVFDGGGLTAVLLLAESHIALHSYPELGYLALDIFTCGKADPAVALAPFKKALHPAKESVRVQPRGLEA